MCLYLVSTFDRRPGLITYWWKLWVVILALWCCMFGPLFSCLTQGPPYPVIWGKWPVWCQQGMLKTFPGTTLCLSAILPVIPWCWGVALTVPVLVSRTLDPYDNNLCWPRHHLWTEAVLLSTDLVPPDSHTNVFMSYVYLWSEAWDYNLLVTVVSDHFGIVV